MEKVLCILRLVGFLKWLLLVFKKQQSNSMTSSKSHFIPLCTPFGILKWLGAELLDPIVRSDPGSSAWYSCLVTRLTFNQNAGNAVIGTWRTPAQISSRWETPNNQIFFMSYDITYSRLATKQAQKLPFWFNKSLEGFHVKITLCFRCGSCGGFSPRMLFFSPWNSASFDVLRSTTTRKINGIQSRNSLPNVHWWRCQKQVK